MGNQHHTANLAVGSINIAGFTPPTAESKKAIYKNDEQFLNHTYQLWVVHRCNNCGSLSQQELKNACNPLFGKIERWLKANPGMFSVNNEPAEVPSSALPGGLRRLKEKYKSKHLWQQKPSPLIMAETAVNLR